MKRCKVEAISARNIPPWTGNKTRLSCADRLLHCCPSFSTSFLNFAICLRRSSMDSVKELNLSFDFRREMTSVSCAIAMFRARTMSRSPPLDRFIIRTILIQVRGAYVCLTASLFQSVAMRLCHESHEQSHASMRCQSTPLNSCRGCNRDRKETAGDRSRRPRSLGGETTANLDGLYRKMHR